MITDLVVIFAAIAIVFTVGYYTRVFIARNEQHIEAADLRIRLSDAKEHIAEVNRQRNTGADQYYRLERDHLQLEADHRHTVEAYAQCDADRLVAEGHAANYADQLRTFGIDPDADQTELQATDEQPDAAVETPTWNDITRLHPITEYKEEGVTEWLKRADIEAAKKATAEVEKRRKTQRVPAARKPAAGS